MITRFKKDKISHTIETLSGNFVIKIIIDNRKGHAIIMTKIFNNNNYYIDENSGKSDLFGNLPDMKIIYTKDTAVIAGIKCHRAIVTSTDSLLKSFNVYFTKHIKLFKPNRKIMYDEIDGILFDFYAYFFNMNMHFRASKFNETDVPDSEFIVPSDYKLITLESLNKITSIIE